MLPAPLLAGATSDGMRSTPQAGSAGQQQGECMYSSAMPLARGCCWHLCLQGCVMHGAVLRLQRQPPGNPSQPLQWVS